MKLMFLNQIVSEITYVTYTFLIFFNYKNKYNLDWQLTTIYVIVNILKFSEGFTTAYAIK